MIYATSRRRRFSIPSLTVRSCPCERHTRTASAGKPLPLLALYSSANVKAPIRIPSHLFSASSTSSHPSHHHQYTCIIKPTYYDRYHRRLWTSNMKGALLVAAGAALLGSGNCGVHKVKLQKVPLTEQLEHADFATQAKSLYQKYSGQRYMGLRPDQHKEEMFKDTSIHPEDDHAVPVTNFLNAQCTLLSASTSSCWLILTNLQTSRKS